MAILKVNSSLESCELVNSDKVALAESLYAFGFPFSYSNESSITKGVFSQRLVFKNNLEYLLTDAKLNPGNLGGPLISK